MRFDRLLNLCLEEFEKEEISGNLVKNKEFAKELGLNGEHITSKELYRVALDIRKHPEDYTGISFFDDLIMYRYNLGTTNEGFPTAMYDLERDMLIGHTYEDKYIFLQHKVNSEFFHKVKNRVTQSSQRSVKNDIKWYKDNEQWALERKDFGNVVFYKHGASKVFDTMKKRQKIIDTVDIEFLQNLLNSNYGVKETKQMSKQHEKFYSNYSGVHGLFQLN